MTVGAVLEVLGGRLYQSDHCEHYSGAVPMCTHNLDCSIRSLWEQVQRGVDQILEATTLKALLSSDQTPGPSGSSLVQIGGAPQVSTTL
jgi:DNA-binding IscR family transcriptional regulator